jgi:hypothetical protein
LAGCFAGDYDRPDHDAFTAKIMCEGFVKDRLRAPRTAKFPAPIRQHHEDLGNGAYFVATYVDAQNAFGAMVRTSYGCKVEWIYGDRWRLVSLDME